MMICGSYGLHRVFCLCVLACFFALVIFFSLVTCVSLVLRLSSDLRLSGVLLSCDLKFSGVRSLWLSPVRLYLYGDLVDVSDLCDMVCCVYCGLLSVIIVCELCLYLHLSLYLQLPALWYLHSI